MQPKTKVSELPDFDMADYLTDDKAIAEYLSVVLEDYDPDLLGAALSDIARARGMTEVARAAGLTREALYKALRPGAQPRFDTLARLCTALGLKLSVEVAA
jgi:probable addiction module antidote protein